MYRIWGFALWRYYWVLPGTPCFNLFLEVSRRRLEYTSRNHSSQSHHFFPEEIITWCNQNNSMTTCERFSVLYIVSFKSEHVFRFIMLIQSNVEFFLGGVENSFGNLVHDFGLISLKWYHLRQKYFKGCLMPSSTLHQVSFM